MNKQLYENSDVPGLCQEQLKGKLDPALYDALFNERTPNLAILHEKPEHRIILWLKVRGYSNREVSEATEFTEAWVSQITRQPWFKAKLLKELETEGRDNLHMLLEGAAEDCVLKLIEIRDTAKPAVARAACVDLLDRFLGKPTQKVETTTDLTTHEGQTMEELDKEIQQLEDQERQLLHRN